MRMMVPLLVSIVALVVMIVPPVAHAAVVNFVSVGGVAGTTYSLSTALHNTAVMNTTLASLRPGDTFFIPNNTFWMMGGVRANGLSYITFLIDGTLKVSSPHPLY
jgi:hypothetical protein